MVAFLARVNLSRAFPSISSGVFISDLSITIHSEKKEVNKDRKT